MRHRAASLFVFLVAIGFPAIAAAAWQVAGTPHVEFTATGPAGLHIVGATDELTVADDGTNVSVNVPLGHLSTGIGLRDHHMLEQLDTEHHPRAVLTVARSALQTPGDQPVEATAQGTLNLHGQRRQVRFHYTARRNGSAIAVTGNARIDMTSFGIEQPSYLGMTVAKEVNVSVRFSVSEH